MADPRTPGAEQRNTEGAGATELTLRALLTGVVLGAALTPCNVYSGLKIGWSFNMSISALLLGLVVWRAAERLGGARRWELLESNISQTTASSAASIISGGLVAPIPALAIVSGIELPYAPLVAWVFAVSFLGVWVAWYLRGALITRSALPFPAGAVTAETMLEIFSHGQQALRRVQVLALAGIASAAVKAMDALWLPITRWSPGALSGKLTFALDPSLLLTGFGAIIGLRAGLSLLAGALLAWGIIGPALLDAGIVTPATGSQSYFVDLVGWLVWPGVSLMVTATLTSLAGNLLGGAGRHMSVTGAAPPERRIGPLLGLAGAAALAVVLQMALFDIPPLAAVLAVPVAFVLAAVVGRVVGETGIPPIGAVAKLSQLSFAVIAPAQMGTNLMTANVAGGAAGQCADLLNDFKAGHLVGARPSHQLVAQCVGILTGSLAGVGVYLVLVPDPALMLLTPEWPAPAVATWKAVAEVLGGSELALPPLSAAAAGVAAVTGCILGTLESLLPPTRLRLLPSASCLGLAFVIPASTSLGLFYGAALAALLSRLFPRWSGKFLVAAAAGLVAGESLIGVALSLLSIGAAGTP